MKTKLCTLFLALVASTGLFWASDTQVNGIWYIFDESTKTASVTYQGEGYMHGDPLYSGSVTIPSSVEYNGQTYSVTSIGEYAFAQCSNLTSVTIPNSVTSIADLAFWNCFGLTSITIPNSITSIEGDAFEGCTGLTSLVYNAHVFVYMPSSYSGAYTIPDGIKSIANKAFENCSGLTSIIIPNSVAGIGYGAFAGCYGLISLELPNNLVFLTDIFTTSYSQYTYENLGSIIIPASVLCDGEYYGNVAAARMTLVGDYYDGYGMERSIRLSNLKHIEAPYWFFDVPEEYWSYCPKNMENVVINRGELNDNILSVIRRSYTTLKSVDLSAATNTELADEAFKGCYNLETLKLPASLTKINYMAVAGCKNLKSIDIPASVEEIGQSAFEDCRSIETITFGGAATPAPGRANAPAASTSQLQRIGNWAFYNAHELQHLTLPEGVTEIGDGAFYGCTYLEDLILPSSVQSIGDNCFALCSKLTKITVNSTTPPTIEAKTFYDVKRQIPVYVPDDCVDAYESDPYWGEFNIQGISEMPMAIDQTTSDQPLTTNKVLHNGQLLILRGDKTYTVTGQEVR